MTKNKLSNTCIRISLISAWALILKIIMTSYFQNGVLYYFLKLLLTLAPYSGLGLDS